MTSLPYLQPPLTATIHKGSWAKFDSRTGEFISLTRHLDDTACTAALLWDHWLPPHPKKLISTNLDGNELLAQKVAIFLSAGHDIGKHSIPFAQKVRPLRLHMESQGSEFLILSPEEIRSNPHSLYSANSLIHWFQENSQNSVPDAINSLATVVAGHHGIFPKKTNVGNRNRTISRERRSHWPTDRLAYWDRAARTVDLQPEELQIVANTILNAPSQMLLCGFVIMADWIASNTDYFPLVDERSSQERAREAFTALRFPGHWLPQPTSDNTELFHNSFSLTRDFPPRPVQDSAMDCARKVSEPSLIIIEAPTGEGKTEAALTASEILASRFALSGVTVALPTCATSDAMFPRFLSWLDHRLPDEATAGTVLSHGKAQFNNEYRSLFSGLDNSFAPIYGERNFSPHWWFTGRKTSSLADFSVGTIDQVLFAALRSKHLVLRHLGLSNKVIVLDEIHSADSYMMVYLKRMLEWMGAMGVPVIALSATLAPARRAELLTAYKSGALARQNQEYPQELQEENASIAYNQHGYPLISAVNSTELEFTELQLSSRSSEFTVSYIGLDTQALVERIVEEAEPGGCIGVVCNTVNKAQHVYAELKGTCPPDTELVLLHSRFLGFERRQIEKGLVERLGPDSTDRPRKLIVISTQVIEQSMDIDFDLMFTDIAPMDLLFQRAGRLHRHNRAAGIRPQAHSMPKLIVSGCDNPVALTPPEIDDGSKAVYKESILLRTLATLLGHGDVLRSPNDVSQLVRLTYAENFSCPEPWRQACEQADDQAQIKENDQIDRAQNYLQPSPDSKPVWQKRKGGVLEAREETRGQAQVRDIEASLEVILVEKGTYGYRTLSFSPEMPGEEIHFGHELDPVLSKVLAKSVVSLPQWTMKNKSGDALLDELELNILSAPEIEILNRNRWLRGQLFLPLDEDFRTEIAGLAIEYSKEMGLTVEHSKAHVSSGH